MTKHLSTSDIARAVGVHPNTVRLYEEWGFLPPIDRAENGYRLFTQAHLDQMRLARTALHGAWPGPLIRESAVALVRLAASGDLTRALDKAHTHLTLVQAEKERAEAAVDFLEQWVQGQVVETLDKPVLIGEAARRLDVTRDMLRNWERNGLIDVPRNPGNGYRQYSAQELGRLRVIRLLVRTGYSMMAILRMVRQLDQGSSQSLRRTLDTPRPEDEVYMAADRWLTTLDQQLDRARELIAQLEAMVRRERT